MRREPRESSPLSRRKGANGTHGSAQVAAPAADSEPFPLYRVLQEDGSADPAEVLLPDQEIVTLYRWMVLNRQLDERMIGLQRQGRINFYIGSIGEEAAVFGTAYAMAPADWIFPCYREHGAALLRGMPLATYVCDLLGNAGDVMLGHQMPCHEAWKPAHFASISSPIGTQIPQAVGAAWAARIKKQEMVALVYFGEGATSANDFHTGLNFAGVHKIPVVFACRNNGWAISVPRERQTAAETIAQKALAYGLRGERVDGNDLLAVYGATRRARERAARGEGATLLECVTYRIEGHPPTSSRPSTTRSGSRCAATRTWSSWARTSASSAASSARPRASTTSSATTASSTRRSPRAASSAPRSAWRSTACGRCRRSSSPTSSSRPSTRS